MARSASSAPRRVRARGTVRVPVGTANPLELFTPLGERVWARDWDPQYPDAASDPAAPGTVFTVSHEGVTTVWVIADHMPGRRIRYVRFRPGMQAGTLTVALDAPGRATVTYDITSLSEEGARELMHFEAHLQAMLDTWSTAIDAALSQPHT